MLRAITASMLFVFSVHNVATNETWPKTLQQEMAKKKFYRGFKGSAGLSLYFMYYNFCRVHQTLRVTPAMEAGISDHIWSIEEMVKLLTDATTKAA
ncbi:MAG TPA: hypothetical protein VNK23_12135 [Candidatus Dormibacteraeota bacterium]|nr:hypothetical protein [Candidatus Dormibacteraeota bacterium]